MQWANFRFLSLTVKEYMLDFSENNWPIAVQVKTINKIGYGMWCMFR